MATLIPESGVFNVNGRIQQKGKFVLTEDEFYTIEGFYIKASANIAASKVVVATGYDTTEKIVTGAELSNLNQTILGLATTAINSGEVGELLTYGKFQSALDSTGKNVGDYVYVTASGDLSLNPSSLRIGTLLTTAPNAVILIDANIDQESADIVSDTKPFGNNTTAVATTEFVNKTLMGINGGRFWTLHSVEASAWTSVTYGIVNGSPLFVAVAETGTNKIMISPNGYIWTPINVSVNNLRSVAYGNGMFVAIGGGVANNVVTSTNGINWSVSTVNANNLISITYGDNKFVAVGDDGTSGCVVTSPDGTVWNKTNYPGTSTWLSVAYNDGRFAATRQNYLMISSDGIGWTTANISGYWKSITYGDGKFVALATNDYETAIYVGGNWSVLTNISEANSWNSVAYGNGVFIAVANTGNYRVATSLDGITWTLRTAPEQNSWRSITYGNRTFVAVSYDGTNRVMRSDI
jgi:hypothetical protein